MDIDIDVPPKTDVTKIFEDVTPASMVEQGELKKHQVGYHFQNIPKDEETGLSAITYKNADNYDFFKIDFISVNLLSSFNNKEELRKYMFMEPDWNMLQNRIIVENLFHLNNSYELLKQVKPNNLMELADCLALIRPHKKHLIDKYVKSDDKEVIREELYSKQHASDLRKSHAIPYAYLVIAQLNLYKEGLKNENR